MISIVDLNHDLNRRFKSLDLNQIHPGQLCLVSS